MGYDAGNDGNGKRTLTTSSALEHEEEQYHVQYDKNVKVGSQVAHVPRKRKSVKSIVSTENKASHIFGQRS